MGALICVKASLYARTKDMSFLCLFQVESNTLVKWLEEINSEIELNVTRIRINQ